jgi:hypothetical protein
MLTVAQNPDGNYSLYETRVNASEIKQFDLVGPISSTGFFSNNIDISNNFTVVTVVSSPQYNGANFSTKFYTYYDGKYYDLAQLYYINTNLVANPSTLTNMKTLYNGTYYDLNSFLKKYILPTATPVTVTTSSTIFPFTNPTYSSTYKVYTFLLSGQTIEFSAQSLAYIFMVGSGDNGSGNYDQLGYYDQPGDGGNAFFAICNFDANTTYTINRADGGNSFQTTSFTGGSINIKTRTGYNIQTRTSHGADDIYTVGSNDIITRILGGNGGRSGSTSGTNGSYFPTSFTDVPTAMTTYIPNGYYGSGGNYNGNGASLTGGAGAASNGNAVGYGNGGGGNGGFQGGGSVIYIHVPGAI